MLQCVSVLLALPKILEFSYGFPCEDLIQGLILFLCIGVIYSWPYVKNRFQYTQRNYRESAEEPRAFDLNKSRELLLREYEAAQASAQHHDNLTWVVTSLAWTASVFLLTSILSEIKEHNTSLLLFFVGSLLGLIFISLVALCVNQLTV